MRDLFHQVVHDCNWVLVCIKGCLLLDCIGPWIKSSEYHLTNFCTGLGNSLVTLRHCLK